MADEGSSSMLMVMKPTDDDGDDNNNCDFISNPRMIPLDGGSFGLSIFMEQKLIEQWLKERRVAKIGQQNVGKLVKISREEHSKLKKFVHPNIVRSYSWRENDIYSDADGDNNLPIISYIELHEIGDLANLIANQVDPFPEYQIQQWLQQLCLALKCLHDAGYVHRNVQPKNILWNGKTVKLGNFTLAEPVDKLKQSKEPAIETSLLPHLADETYWPYSAPELWLFKRYTPKCDLWSLGIIAYELTFLRLPFRSDDYPGVISAILFNEPEPFSSETRSFCSGQLENFISKMLEKDSNQRPSIDDAIEEPFLQMLIKPEEISVGKDEETTEIENRVKISGIPKEQLPQVLLQAVENDDCEFLQNVLTSVKDKFDVRTMERFTSDGDEHPLHAAARLGKVNICKLLIDVFAVPVDLLDSNNSTPLNEAALNCQLEVVDFLVKEKQANVENRSKPNGRTPFLNAVQKGHLKIAETLAANGASVDAVDDLKTTAMHLAVENSKFEVADFLLKKWPDFLERRNGDNDDAQLPFDDDDSRSNCQAVEFFINHTKQVQINQNRTPLLHACYQGNVDAVKFLVERGASLEARSNWSNYLTTPVHLATARGHLGCVDFLLRTQPSLLESRTIFNDTPLNIAAAEGHFVIVEYLVKCRRANKERQGLLSRTPLLQAAAKGHLRVVKFLIEQGANWRVKDDNMLLKWDDDDNKTTNRHQHRSCCLKSSIIHLAAENGHVDIVRYLLEIDPGLLEEKDSENGTALNRAASAGQVKIVKLLLSSDYGANVENRGFLGRTPLMEAAVNGNLAVVEYLVRKGKADLLAKDAEYENSALHLAAHFGHASVAAYLIDAFITGQRGFFLEMRNSLGHTPMSYARMRQNHHVCKLLEQKGAAFS